MYLGAPQMLDDEDISSTRRKTTLGNVVYITDGKNDMILDVIQAKDAWWNEHFKSKTDNQETFDLDVLGGKSYDEYLIKGNRLIVPGEDEGELIEFVIDEVEDRRNTHKKLEIKCYASYLDLDKAKVFVEPFSFTGTAREHMYRALSNTNHEVGIVESNNVRTISFEDHTNSFEYLRRIAKEFELELNFRVEHGGNRIVRRPVDALDRVGYWRGREITFGKDLQEINRIETGDIYTALIGLGPEREDGTRLQVLVEDREALERWGRPEHNPQHLIGVYEPQSEREDMTLSELRQYTKTELDKRCKSYINYEISFLDLEHLLGHENKKIRFGDTIRIKDTYYEPRFYVEARIFEMKRNVFVPAQKEYVLGDFVEYTEEQVRSVYDLLKRELAKKAGIEMLLNYAEPRKVESDTPPPIKDGENPIWIDTSQTPKVPHVVIAGEWVKMSPTEAIEIGAETPEGAQSKANSAETNANKYTNNYAYSKKKVDQEILDSLNEAKIYSENAENIKRGIIDVGAVPLRTSETGARLAWDGVNGFYQYDSSGNITSHIDLDGNARFLNAFVAGRIEASAGFFGDNLRLSDGKLQIIRPDGAVWMQDGMTNNNYSVSSYDPHDMDMSVWRWNDGGTERAERDVLFINYNGFWRALRRQMLGLKSGAGKFDDPRDPNKGYTAKFNSYEFVHEARYLVIGFRGAINSNNVKRRVRVYETGTVPSGYSAIYHAVTHEKGENGYLPLIIDMGKPSYKRRQIELRVGSTRDWMSNTNDEISFRINRIYLTDYI